MSPATLGRLAVALALAACGSKPDPADRPVGEPAGRTNGAKVAAPRGESTAAFCDVHVVDDRGPAFRWPALAPGGAAPAAPTTWRWVNLWATWCKPCIEEMPRLAAWRDRLAKAGTRIDLTFVSVDDSDATIDEFRKAHPETPPSIRIVSAEQRTAWLKGLGLDDGAIPIQLFVSPANRLRCARAGGIRDKDYDVVARLLTE